MRKAVSPVLAALLCATLLACLCAPASAFARASAGRELQSAWEEAENARDPDQIVAVAQRSYDLLLQAELNGDICRELEPRCAKASWCCEIKGDLEGAAVWLERQRTFAAWLEEHEGGNRETLQNIDARLEYLDAAAAPVIYALTNEEESPFAVGPRRGTWQGSCLGGSQTGESAVLAYVGFQDGYSVEYWLNSYKSQPAFAQAAGQGGVVQLAWDCSPENTAGVDLILDPTSNSYITEGVRAMATLNATVLLRVGAGVNSWEECDSAKYVQAFQKIAREARKYSNIQMVFSLSDVSRREMEFEKFYPGDQYVDWIGVSTFHNSNYTFRNGRVPSYALERTDYQDDAYYGMGLYDSDPLVVLRPLARFAQSHGKPVVISECGFSYRNNSTGADQTGYAVEQLTKFYSYVNMVFPQVKAVFYFDHTDPEGMYPYALEDSQEAAFAYRAAIVSNAAYLTGQQPPARSWEELNRTSTLLTGSSRLRLAAYVSLPGVTAPIVSYFVDGSEAYTPSAAPYYFEIDVQTLTPGRHTLWVTARSGQFSSTSRHYTFYVSDTGLVMGEDGLGEFQVDAASDWAQGLLMSACGRGLVTPNTQKAPQSPITRLQFAGLAVNLIEQTIGESIPPSEQTFSDTEDEVVRKAVAAGVAAGREEGLFAPGDRITRQEICVMLRGVIRYVDEIQGTVTLTNEDTRMDSRFIDNEDIAGWAVESVALMTNNGLMSGTDEGRVAPESNTTVEEAVALILALSYQF